MRHAACILQLIALAIIGSYSDKLDRTVGGISTTIEKYPHCASIRVLDNLLYFCGASIIDEYHVLTAAHCVEPIVSNITLLKSVKVVTGTGFLNNSGQIHEVADMWYHDDYDLHVNGVNDIAVIRLADPILFDSKQKLIRLPTSDLAENDSVTIAAWGQTGPNDPIHNDLRELHANVMLSDTCQKFYGDSVYIDKNDCCTLIKEGMGTCNGDSGSALIRDIDNTIVGLVSFGLPCAKGVPDVFTNVIRFIFWILDKLSR